MLIHSNRFRYGDLDYWQTLEYQDKLYSQINKSRIDHKISNAIASIRLFTLEKPAYASISWGKDSTVLAHLVASHNISIPLVWIKVIPIFNPDCEKVRDAFISKYQCNYIEQEVTLIPDTNGKYHASKSLESGFKSISKTLETNRYITGIRGDESGIRKMRQKINGVATLNTLAPITYWSTQDIYSYLYRFDLPVHPAYAMTKGGIINREHIRVASIGGKRGSNFDRTEWEKLYYPDILGLN